jgi:hypothetical protein
MTASYMAYGRNWAVSTHKALAATDSSGAVRDTVGEHAVSLTGLSNTCCCV